MTLEFALSMRDNCLERANKFSVEIFNNIIQKLIDTPISELEQIANSVDASTGL